MNDLPHAYTPERKLSSARYVFLHGKGGLGRSDFRTLWGLTRVFRRWVGEECYLAGVVYDEIEKVAKGLFWPAKKRGNEAYVRGVRGRVYSSVPSSGRLNKKLFASNGSAHILHITLTVDPKRCFGGVNRAWRIVSREYNKFITAFRKRYGRCWVLRSFECQRNGYPHVHIFLICAHSFNAEWHVSKTKGNSRWIVKETKDRHVAPNLGVEVDGFENLWRFGFVNCRAVGTHPKFRDTVKIQNYIIKNIAKYMLKEADDLEKADAKEVFTCDFDKIDLTDKRKWNVLLTYSLTWLFRKQGFSISDKKMLGDVSDLTKRRLIQTGEYDFTALWGLFGVARYRFLEFIGVVHMVRPPPVEPVTMSWDDLDELKRLAIGK